MPSELGKSVRVPIFKNKKYEKSSEVRRSMVLYASDRSGREVCECHMYETVVRCAVGVTEGFQLGVWLHRC